MGPIGIVGFGALGVLVLLWLVISFTARSPRREVLEWIAAFCLYLSLCMLFLNLVLRAHAADNWFALVAFAFLGFVFVCGSCVSLFHVFRAIARSTTPPPQSSATN
ncbi:MAG: hypothetical protein QNK04_30890 [Myxococcota bacterium]|nr:hypothetical protein [Myxococcota bacterium]